ncbi:fungal-specific transcription factor domain-containing protein [Talaromyces proteolyticus]|uniref:Fungal-specific transcription factor domain-containing protein n=1 Tax=Talaromyces proteolyticus TaxID=1131652 RepID=A0AAD4KP44_9EURO|nr:fungal-specific transcription factor domain-containing protein [Talaromyces proteolyticus]KAH8696175.1 fungal-specific transcription factor domain-containing protein [Talaromyces proteolyticus]
MPSYIKPFSSNFPSDDTQFLYSKGALTPPRSELRYALLESYINWIHPICPLLDLGHFLSALLSNGSEGQISLLLFHAVMFAGSAFVDMSYLQAAGFESRIAAREHLFIRTKLVYDFKYEDDRLRIVQSLLLMSYWQEKHEDSTNHWYWVAVACLVARTIGLFRNPAGSKMSEERQKLWKRVGWSCLLRDRVLSLGVRQRPKILVTEFELPLLEETDFEIVTLPTTAINTAAAVVLGHCKFLRDTVLQQKLALLCIEKAKLCIFIEEIFRKHYIELSPKLGMTTEITNVLFPKTHTLDLESTTNIETNLQIWLQQFPERLQYAPDSEPRLDRGEDVLVVHSTLLKMLYHTITCALNHPVLLNLSSQSTAPENDLRIVKRRMRHSTVQIMRHFEDLQNLGLICFLPSASVTMLLTAAINHLVEYRTSSQEHGERYLRHFWDCICYLKPLQSVHIYAQIASHFLYSVAQQVGVRMMDPFLREKSDDLGVWASVHMPGHLLQKPLERRPEPVAFQVGGLDYNHASLPHQSVLHTYNGQDGGESPLTTAEEDSITTEGISVPQVTGHAPPLSDVFNYQPLWNMWGSQYFEELTGCHYLPQN